MGKKNKNNNTNTTRSTREFTHRERAVGRKASKMSRKRRAQDALEAGAGLLIKPQIQYLFRVSWGRSAPSIVLPFRAAADASFSKLPYYQGTYDISREIPLQVQNPRASPVRAEGASFPPLPRAREEGLWLFLLGFFFSGGGDI